MIVASVDLLGDMGRVLGASMFCVKNSLLKHFAMMGVRATG